jgi:LacI family transcriptional regulator
MRKGITIRDVAKNAGVSVATVSNVLNNVNKVSEKTKERILKIMEEMDYQPDFTARSLAMKRSKLLGIILPPEEEDSGPNTALQDNPFYSEFISGVEYTARREGYDLLITGVSTENGCKEWVLKRKLDGLILFGISSEKLTDDLELPKIIIDSAAEVSTNCLQLGVDDLIGGYLATKHLIELGHPNIALATGKIGTSQVNSRRYHGYQKALQEHNLKEIIFEKEVSFNGGFRIGEDILKYREITAVFAVADIMAFGLIKAFRSNGRKVPQDYSVVGFDDLRICEFSTPGLTTIKQNVVDKGMIAAELLIDKIKGGEEVNRNIVLPVELVIRETTGRR